MLIKPSPLPTWCILSVITIATVPLAAGCRSRPSNAEPTHTPSETIAMIRDARARGAYQEIEALVVSQRARQVSRTLLAIDGFLLANRQLGDTVRERCGHGLAETIDQSYLVRNLEVFSRSVEIVSERREGERALVSILVNNQLPMRTAELVIENGEWRYDPGPGFDAAFPAAFDAMRDGLLKVREDLLAGRLDAAAIRRDPDRMAREVVTRLTPGVKLLPTSRPSGD